MNAAEANRVVKEVRKGVKADGPHGGDAAAFERELRSRIDDAARAGIDGIVTDTFHTNPVCCGRRPDRSEWDAIAERLRADGFVLLETVWQAGWRPRVDAGLPEDTRGTAGIHWGVLGTVGYRHTRDAGEPFRRDGDDCHEMVVPLCFSY